jgi:hypothetical protein
MLRLAKPGAAGRNEVLQSVAVATLQQHAAARSHWRAVCMKQEKGAVAAARAGVEQLS